MTAMPVMTDPADPLLGSEAHGKWYAVVRRGSGNPGGTAAGARDAAGIAELPVELAVAIRLHRAGYVDDVIAAALDIPLQSVPVTLRIARGKLAQLAGDTRD